MGLAEVALVVSTGILLVFVGMALGVYLRAVRHGLRMYRHVILAFTFVLLATTIGAWAIIWPSTEITFVRAAVNLIGIMSMIDLARRYRPRPHRDADRPRRPAQLS